MKILRRANNKQVPSQTSDSINGKKLRHTYHKHKFHKVSDCYQQPRKNVSDDAEKFKYGNFSSYYGYRNQQGEDPRLTCMKKVFFEGKDVLDIGCNVGHFTLSIAKKFLPRKIIGIDIDGELIKTAQKNVKHYLSASDTYSYFPLSLIICHGPVLLPEKDMQTPRFPFNIYFVQGNYILESDHLLEMQTAEFDTILCLSITKWIHLNWGDDGIKQMFHRTFKQLRPGGNLILEYQSWSSYSRKKKITETTYKNYNTIQFYPEQFNDYLLKEVGFKTCELLDTPAHHSKGFCRPIYVFNKELVPTDCSENTDSNKGGENE